MAIELELVARTRRHMNQTYVDSVRNDRVLIGNLVTHRLVIHPTFTCKSFSCRAHFLGDLLICISELLSDSV